MNMGLMARRRFLLTEKVQSGKNAHGEPIYVWKTKYYFGGKLVLKKGEETQVGSMQVQAIATHELTIHYRQAEPPTPLNRIVGGSATFEIVSIGDKMGDGKILVLQLKQLVQ